MMLCRSRTFHFSFVRRLQFARYREVSVRTPFVYPNSTYRLGLALKRSSSSKISPSTVLTVVQYPSIDRAPPKDSSSNLYISGNVDPNSIQRLYGARSILYTSERCPESTSASAQVWTQHKPPLQDSSVGDLWKGSDSVASPLFWMSQQIYHKLLIHFVPAQYPNSVQQPGYTYYASYGFIASVAGSASMVLSTQTLLCTMMSCTVGGEQSTMTTTTASTAAGALNWVLKDGIGQLGGIVVASYMGQMRSLDSNPKRYRMFAAILLDAAAIVELSTPLSVLVTSSSAVVPMACLATLCKNVGFIMASASRATLHQSLCIPSNETKGSSTPGLSTVPNNLADVTAKFSSQSTAAGLLGTLLGITMSRWMPAFGNPLDYGYFNIYSALAILGLISVHQVCNYMALRSVALHHLNRQRLCIILNHYIQPCSKCGHKSMENIFGKKVLTPTQVAEREYFLPLLFEFSTNIRRDATENSLDWLKIGCSLQSICPKGPEELMKLVAASKSERYVLNIDGVARDGRIQLVFFEQANGYDIIRGMLHAFVLRDALVNRPGFCESKCVDDSSLEEDGNLLSVIQRSHQLVQSRFNSFIDHLHAVGWNTNTTFVEEGGKSYRFAVHKDPPSKMCKK